MELKDITVLVVDDVNAMRVKLKEILRACGFVKILSASNGATAKQALTEEPVHLILSDLHMDPMNGVDLLKYIRSNPDTLNLPFLMITAETTKEMVLTSIENGVDDYVIKPVAQDSLSAKITKVLKTRGVI